MENELTFFPLCTFTINDPIKPEKAWFIYTFRSLFVANFVKARTLVFISKDSEVLQ